MDPFDSLVVKRIEGKEKLKKKIIKSQKSVSICCKGEGKFVPMKVAIQEASSKNSLLERINSLETRLFQLCLEIENARTSCSSSSNIQTPFAEKSKNNDAKRQAASSYPIFDFSQIFPSFITKQTPHSVSGEFSDMAIVNDEREFEEETTHEELQEFDEDEEVDAEDDDDEDDDDDDGDEDDEEEEKEVIQSSGSGPQVHSIDDDDEDDEDNEDDEDDEGDSDDDDDDDNEDDEDEEEGEEEEDLGTEYLVRPVAHAEDEEDASDFEPEENGEEEAVEEEEEEDDDEDTSEKVEAPPKRKRSGKDDDSDDDDGGEDEDDERPSKR